MSGSTMSPVDILAYKAILHNTFTVIAIYIGFFNIFNDLGPLYQVAINTISIHFLFNWSYPFRLLLRVASMLKLESSNRLLSCRYLQSLRSVSRIFPTGDRVGDTTRNAGGFCFVNNGASGENPTTAIKAESARVKEGVPPPPPKADAAGVGGQTDPDLINLDQLN